MGTTLLAAAISTEKAISDSTRRAGGATTPRTARLKVIECATVKAVTTFRTCKKAWRIPDTGCHRPSARDSTDGRSNVSRKRI